MSKKELVQIVDDKNTVLGSAPREEMRAKGLPHRAAYILVFNSRGEIFVQKRTKTKDIYPGYYDVATGGVVLAGESYEHSANRELKEELGISVIPLTAHFDFYHADSGNRVWGRAFSCVYDGPITLQEEEVEDGFFADVKTVFTLAEQNPLTPDGLLVLKKFLSMQGWES